MKIIIDDLANGAVLQLLEEHLADMYATSPPESVHALDVNALKHPSITFYSAWETANNEKKLLGCVALKKLTPEHAEIKSMRTTVLARKKGVASNLLDHLIFQAKTLGFKQLSLETGSMDFFKPARSLYEKYQFAYCQPFGDYQLDVNSQFMTREI